MESCRGADCRTLLKDSAKMLPLSTHGRGAASKSEAKRLLGAIVVLVPAALPGAPTMISCQVEGWSVDPDQTGVRVRAGPDRAARQLGRLPAFVRSGDGDYGPAFAITGAQHGWLRIADARDTWRPSDLPRRPVYAGVGWVHGSRLRLGIQSGAGRTAPAASAPLVVDIGRNWLSDYGKVIGGADCRGKWGTGAYVIPAGKPARGARQGAAWFTNSCGDQRTTCDLPDVAAR